MTRRPLALAVAVLLAATLANARVVSYAPYTDRISVPAMGLRLNRHFALVETTLTQFVSAGGQGQIVLYDSRGEEEPRVIYPQDGTQPVFDAVAVRERGDEPAMILATTSATKWVLSVDAGKTWKTVAINNRLYVSTSFFADTGGWYARNRYSNVRIGTQEFPFVVVTTASDGYRLIAISNDGATKQLMSTPFNSPINLLGSDIDHNRFLVRANNEIDIVDIDGAKTFAGTAVTGLVEGWITSSGSAYVEAYVSTSDISLWYYANGTKTFVAGTYDKSNPSAFPPPPSTTTTTPFFSVPTSTYEGAWMIKRPNSAPTQLLEHHAAGGNHSLIEHWSDITAPEVEAIHPSLAGDKLLIQVHRQRRSADALFKDPALAVWHVGTPAPKSYDELYLSEQADKGFLHLDVDKLESGDVFVFDSGRGQTGGCTIQCVSAGGGGGGDVLQEWGVVRASLAQHLVLPGFGRTAGAYGSLWRSDLSFSNPNDAPVKVALRFVASGDSLAVSETKAVKIELAPRELRLVADAAKELFGMEGGVGALFIDPDTGASINVTGRTYTQSSNGTFGYGMNAVDIYAAASSRFPVSFAAAFQGSDYRTNFFMTDVSGRGSAASFVASGPYGDVQINSVPMDMTAYGVLQRNGLGSLLGLTSSSIGALTVKPTRGEAVAALFSIDNRTNDSTFFPPDLSTGTTRTIPVIGHLAGANGSEFRSDLFLYNTASTTRFVSIEMRSWTSTNDVSTLTITLLAHEARMVPDVLKSMFNRTGMARLRIVTQGTALDNSVRVTSRTYTVDANGGTYGFLMPPLNNFQSASTGDTLEILGAVMDKRFRTNIGLVDVTNSFSSLTPRARVDIIGSSGTTIDSFETTVASLGGTQLNDIFRARSLLQDGQPVMIRISPLQGMLGAYAAMVDNESNDPMYFAANLGAK